ncbi:MAG: hypothetical protein SVU88_02265 [Candidatus Nanohaloarchaea archaeon]|nr:hypothetical protein [Candidatus Nanohaloarchaea archaeon]
MTWYKRVENPDGSGPGAVTAYEKVSGRKMKVDVHEAGGDLYAEVPDDAHDDYLADSEYWDESSREAYRSAAEPEEGEAVEESGNEADEQIPAFGDADLDEVPYAVLQHYASEYEDVAANQSREDLVADLEDKRSGPSDEGGAE